MPGVDRDEEKIRWFLVALYTLDAADLLDPTRQLKLAHVAEQCSQDSGWRTTIEQDLEIDAPFVRSLLDACREQMTLTEAVTFFLRGLGCPYPEARARDVSGEAFDD